MALRAPRPLQTPWVPELLLFLAALLVRAWYLTALASTPLVDVLIPTYNEDLSIIERSIVGALALDHPRIRVWLLDDGRRAPVEAPPVHPDQIFGSDALTQSGDTAVDADPTLGNPGLQLPP